MLDDNVPTYTYTYIYIYTLQTYIHTRIVGFVTRTHEKNLKYLLALAANKELKILYQNPIVLLPKDPRYCVGSVG